MLLQKILDHSILLASQSPRRQMLLEGAGIPFRKLPPPNIEERFPDDLPKEEIPVYLAKLKSRAYKLVPGQILITADTIVWLNGKVVNKPENYGDAMEMLKSISGNIHEVITGVCMRSAAREETFFSLSTVYFNVLSEEEIAYYLNNYKPYDKAGAYGIQEWIGYVGVKKIDGSFYNVMGLPIELLYRKLEKFIDNE